jgi:hypothetical protein
MKTEVNVKLYEELSAVIKDVRIVYWEMTNDIRHPLYVGRPRLPSK